MKQVMSNEILKIEKLKKYFHIGKDKKRCPIYVRAVDEVTLNVNYGETLGLVGESG